MHWHSSQFLAAQASSVRVFSVMQKFWLFLLLCTKVPEDSEDAAAEETQQKVEEVNEEDQSEEETWEDKDGECCWINNSADGV